MEQKNFFSLINDGNYSTTELDSGICKALSEISSTKQLKFLKILDEALLENPEKEYQSIVMETYLIVLDYLPVNLAVKRIEPILEIISRKKLSFYFLNKALDLIIKIVNTWSVKKINNNKIIMNKCYKAIPHPYLEPLVNLVGLKRLNKASVKELINEKRFIISCCVSQNQSVKALALRLAEKIPQTVVSTDRIKEVENIFLLSLAN